MSQYEYYTTEQAEFVDVRSEIDDLDFTDLIAALLNHGFGIIREGISGEEILLTFKRDIHPLN